MEILERPMLIGEGARRTGLTRDTVRFYERAGLISSGARAAGSRVYNEFAPAVVERLEFIRRSQSAGFTLREIKGFLDEWGDDLTAIPDAAVIAAMARPERGTARAIWACAARRRGQSLLRGASSGAMKPANWVM